MQNRSISKAALGRVPRYLHYLQGLPPAVQTISAAVVAKEIGLGEVQVRKDFHAICGAGRPKTGYSTTVLQSSLQAVLTPDGGGTVIIGAGALGQALLAQPDFAAYGLHLYAAFDSTVPPDGDRILPLDALPAFCRTHPVSLGIIATAEAEAQSACNILYENGIRAMLCFPSCRLYQPADAVIRYANLALTLAQLKKTAAKG